MVFENARFAYCKWRGSTDSFIFCFPTISYRGRPAYAGLLKLKISSIGEILAFQLTQGDVADVAVAELLSKDIVGKLFGDKSYISTVLGQRLLQRGLELFTKLGQT
mgnify:CR=1 FL=1